jgi:hypothetical protein
MNLRAQAPDRKLYEPAPASAEVIARVDHHLFVAGRAIRVKPCRARRSGRLS